MTRTGVTAAVFAFLSFLRAPDLPAQVTIAWLDQAERAYRDLEYDRVAELIRGGLSREPEMRMAERARALTYLAASELFRGRRDTAVAVLSRLLVTNPRYRPDDLIFPPAVTDLFQTVRMTTKAVTVRVQPNTDLRIGDDRLAMRLLVTSYHDVSAVIVRDDGDQVRSLYSGPVADSLDLSWNGRDAGGLTVEDGSYLLRVTSRTPGGPRVLRVVHIPLDIRGARPDTVPEPPALPDSLFLPERARGKSGFGSLGAGLLAAAAIVAMPHVLAGPGEASSGRYAVAGAAGVLGIVGFVIQRPSKVLLPNVRANAALREAWTRRVTVIRAENAERKRNLVLRIHAGTATTLDPDNP